MPQVVFDGQGNAVAVWQRFNGSNYIVQAAVRPAGGMWQTPTDLSAPGQNADPPEIAIDGHGNAVAIWDRFNGSNYIVQAAVRPAGGVWQAPTDLSAPGQDAYAPEVAFDGQGTALAVWDRSNGSNDIVRAAVRPAGGVWQTPTDLSAPGQNAYAPEVAVDGHGNAVAVWDRYNGSNYIVQAAVRPAGGVWQTPTDLSAPGQNAYEPHVAVDGQGNAVAVWRRSNGTNYIVQAALRPAGGMWQTPTDLSAPGQSALELRVAFDGDGNAVAVWRRYNGSNYIVQAALRPAGGMWQTPTDLSAPGQSAYEPEVAFDGQGNAVSVWDRSNGSNSIIQGVGYDAAGPLLRSLSIPVGGIAGQAVAFSVAPLDVWSPLGATNWSFGDGATGSGTSITHIFATAGSYPVTATSADVLSNSTSGSHTIAIAPAPTPTPSSVRPTITNAKQSHRRWRAGGKVASLARAHKPPIGTTFSLRLNESARLAFVFAQTAIGRKIGASCVAQTKHNRHTHACKRSVTRGTLVFSGRSGLNSVRFFGRLSGNLKLGPGRYTVLIIATDATQRRSRPALLQFTIVR